MDPDHQSPLSIPPAGIGPEPVPAPESTAPAAPEKPYRGLLWVFIGPQGLRAGWSVLLFFPLFIALNAGIDAALSHFHLIGRNNEFTPQAVFFGELGGLLALLAAVALVGIIERRRILDYNLSGSRRPQHFFFGLVSGFIALSALAGGLVAGGWLHIAYSALSSTAICRFAFLWGCVFLIGACLEEGTFRCYGLFTLARGINFWWALSIVAMACAYQAILVRGTASWGVYAAALLGVFPCFILHQRSGPRSGSGGGSGFWCAAWVTSTLFGFVHVGNPGEAWVGIFGAAFVGFIFCVSVRITGSAWWAIGCHAAWDWAETYFYGTADSGLKPHGSFLSSTPAGNPLWSGGTVGPEGSLLILGAVLLLLALLLLYGRVSSQSAAGSV